jgi:hypothetical protein
MIKGCSKCGVEFNCKNRLVLCPTCYRIYERGEPDVIIQDEIQREVDGKKFNQEPYYAEPGDNEVLTGVPPVLD